MRLKAPLIGGLALASSVGLHLAGFAMKPSSGIQIEGGAPMQAAMLGNSFADMTEGSVDSVPRENVTEPVDEVEQIEPVAQVEPEQPVEKVDAAQPVTETTPAPAIAKPAVAETPQPKMATLAAPAAMAITESRSNPVVALIEQPVPTAHRPAVRPPLTTTPPPVAKAVQPPVTPPVTPPIQPVEKLAALVPAPAHETLKAEAPVERLQAQPDTVRPVARPQKPDKPQVAKPAKPKQAPAPATRKGGDQAAKKGQADGNKSGKVATSSNQPAVASGAAGNAAVSNYPGLVMNKIRRVRKERAGAKGKATVGFKVSASGAVASVRILRSSGSAKIDRIALRHVQRASPFPAPPKGARRSFSVVFVSKR